MDSEFRDISGRISRYLWGHVSYCVLGLKFDCLRDLSFNCGGYRDWFNFSDLSCFINIVQAIFKPPKPIRGGIPICFPQVCTSNDNISVFHDCFHRDNTALEGK